MIAIIDYGLGNIKSIENMLLKIGEKPAITSDPNQIRHFDKIILPGVGSFDCGMENLQRMSLTSVLNEQVIEKGKPVLGICLGMQLMTQKSEEGHKSGLAWIKAATKRFSFPSSSSLKIPHMGWNTVTPTRTSKLFSGLDSSDTRFYFVHSYYVECCDNCNVLATTNYGLVFSCAIVQNNIFGVQFHPEKSHKFGMQLLKNFAEI